LDYAATKGRYDCEKEEREKVKRFEADGTLADGLWLIGLCKTYKSGFLGYSGKEDVKALKNVYLEVSDGELLGILGHNGAGKTTLINILTGLVS